MVTHKGDKMPVGIYRRMEPFTPHKIQLQKHDVLYLFTDGVVDLFGGDKERRLYSKGLQEIILSCYKFKLSHQKYMIEEALSNWQGDNKQTDDMLLIGFKV